MVMFLECNYVPDIGLSFQEKLQNRMFKNLGSGLAWV